MSNTASTKGNGKKAQAIAVPKGVGQEPAGGLKMRLATDIPRRQLEWLWERYIPRGTLTMITGDPQAGKSTLVCELLAACSTARPMPGERRRQRVEFSWFLNAEDGAEDTITWRLDNQAADAAKIWITDEKVALHGRALEALEAKITEQGISIVVIDTLTTWMEGSVDMANATASSDWMNQFMQIAKRTRCAIVFLRHKRKSGGSNKLHQGLGSITFTGIVRSELLITSKEQDGTVVRTVEKIKGTVGKAPPPLHYMIEETENQHGKLRWLQPGEFGLTAVTKPSGTPKKLGQCRDFIATRLFDGPVEADTMIKEVAQAKYSPSTRDRAKRGLVVSYKEGGIWWWRLGEGTQSALPKGIDDVEDDVLPLAPLGVRSTPERMAASRASPS